MIFTKDLYFDNKFRLRMNFSFTSANKISIMKKMNPDYANYSFQKTNCQIGELSKWEWEQV